MKNKTRKVFGLAEAETALRLDPKLDVPTVRTVLHVMGIPNTVAAEAKNLSAACDSAVAGNEAQIVAIEREGNTDGVRVAKQISTIQAALHDRERRRIGIIDGLRSTNNETTQREAMVQIVATKFAAATATAT